MKSSILFQIIMLNIDLFASPRDTISKDPWYDCSRRQHYTIITSKGTPQLRHVLRGLPHSSFETAKALVTRFILNMHYILAIHNYFQNMWICMGTRMHTLT